MADTGVSFAQFGLMAEIASAPDDTLSALAERMVGCELPDEQQDDTGMSEVDAELLPRPLKAVDVRRGEVEQQQRADEVAARQRHGHLVAEEGDAPDEPVFEVANAAATVLTCIPG